MFATNSFSQTTDGEQIYTQFFSGKNKFNINSICEIYIYILQKVATNNLEIRVEVLKIYQNVVAKYGLLFPYNNL